MATMNTSGLVLDSIGAECVAIFLSELRDEGIAHHCGREYKLRYEGGWRHDVDAYEGMFVAVCEECDMRHGGCHHYCQFRVAGAALHRGAIGDVVSHHVRKCWNELREHLRNFSGRLYPELAAEVAEELTLWLARYGPMNTPTFARWCEERGLEPRDVQGFAVKMGLAYMPESGPIDLNYVFYGQQHLDTLVLSLPEGHPLAVAA